MVVARRPAEHEQLAHVVLRFRASRAVTACAPRGSGDEQVSLGDPTLTASWALAFRLTRRVFYRIDRPSRAIGVISVPNCSQRASCSCESSARRTCKTVPMTSGPHVIRGSRLEPQPSGATHDDSQDLGPITPELALVDPVLAERARTLLPEPREETRRRRPPAPAAQRGGAVRSQPVSAPGPRSGPSRWRRTVVLAALVFAAGAVFGGLLETNPSGSPQVPLEVEAGAPPTTTPADRQGLTRRKRSSGASESSAHRPLSQRGRTDAATGKHRQQRQARGARPIWSANVLGVTAAVDSDGVRLVWQRPSRFDRVVVFRTPGKHDRGGIVYRGRATSYRDRSARPCTAYRYLIVNYDQAGHRSTGVPTSVVTEGCT